MTPQHRRHLLEGQRAAARYAFAPPTRVQTGLAGALMANRPGSSLEFMDHRAYQPGDDLRRIDWSAFARSDRLTVKLYRQEVNPHVDILLDASRSMDLAGTAKGAAALSLAALLAGAADNAGYTHAAWAGRETFQPVPNGAAAPVAWEGIDFDYRQGHPAATGGGGDADGLAGSFAAAAGQFRPRSIRVLLSDLLWAGDPTLALSPLSASAAAVVVVQLLAEADVDPPPHGNVRLTDSETDEEQEIFVDAAARSRYRDALARHQQNWHRAASQCGAVMTTLVAERFLRDWNLDELLEAGVLHVT